jgi:hypothetical protein
MPEYKGNWIALVEVAPQRWLSTIQRRDGRKVNDLATGKSFTIWECPRSTVSAEAVIDGSRLGVEEDGD